MPKWSRIFALLAGLTTALPALAQTVENGGGETAEPAPTPTGDPLNGVGIIDAGTNAAGINLQGGQNFVGDANDLSDNTDNQHGTTSSQIVNSQAPGIPIFAYKVTNNNEDFAPGTTDAAIIAAAANRDVAVIALTNPYVLAPSGVMGAAAAQGKFISVTTGNTSGGQPQPLAVGAVQFPGVVAVAGTDGAGGVLPNSANCGIIMSRCLRARGVTPFANYGGASFGAANLAGIAAEVWRAAPNLTAEELAQVLFATALDFGAPGIDEVYGNGFIFDAAQVINSPAGPVSVPTGGGGGGGGGAAVAVGVVALGAAVGAGVLSRNKDKLEKTLVLDPFGRPFVIDLTKMTYVRDTNSISVSGYLRNLDELYNNVNVAVGAMHAVDFSYSTFNQDLFEVGRHFALHDDLAYADQELDWSAKFRSTRRYGLNYQMDINTDPALNFGAMGSITERGRQRQPVAFLSGQSFNSPYLGFTSRADSVAMDLSGRSGWGLQLALVESNTEDDPGSKSMATVLEGSYEFGKRGKLTAQFGQLRESGSMFGGSSGGVFGVDGSTTYALSVSGAWHLSNRVSLIGNYGIGYTNIDDKDASLFHDFSSQRSNWFGVGVIGYNLFRDHDQWGFAFSQPLRVENGSADLHVPYAKDFSENIYSNVDRIDLSPNGRELTLETFYRMNLTRRASVGAHFMYQHEPQHDSDAGDELTVLATVRYGF